MKAAQRRPPSTRIQQTCASPPPLAQPRGVPPVICHEIVTWTSYDPRLGWRKFSSCFSPQPRWSPSPQVAPTVKMQTEKLAVYYGEAAAVHDVSIDILANQVLALIGPSGCGKSTFLRTLNRMNDTISGARVTGKVLLDGRDIYAADVDPVAVRRQVGMVFQKSNPFPEEHLRERRVRSARGRPQRPGRPARTRRARACARRRSGTRSKIAWKSRR